MSMACGYRDESLRRAVRDGHLLCASGCDGPDSDRIKRMDLESYRATRACAPCRGIELIEDDGDPFANVKVNASTSCHKQLQTDPVEALITNSE